MVIKKVALLLTAFLLVNTALADSYSKEEKTTNFIVTPSIAYRYDVFKWSVPCNRFPDKKLSELVWKNRIIQPSIKVELEPRTNQLTFLGQVKYGHILKNQSKSWDYDWYYEKDGTGNIISQSDSITKSQATGNILDLSGAVGYSLGLFEKSLLTFYLGYNHSDYRNKNYGDKQLAYKTNFSFSSGGLSQKYYFKTYSPWVGLSINTPITDRFQVVPTIKFYSFKHIGKGYWIHRCDLKQNPSLKNTAKGKGIGFDLDFIYKYTHNLDFKINLEVIKLKMKIGKNQAFYNSFYFGDERVFTGKLFDLTHISSSITAGLKYKL
jgi:hypothetical protein